MQGIYSKSQDKLHAKSKPVLLSLHMLKTLKATL